MMLANLAKSAAPSSRVKFVATSRFAIVFVNSAIFSVWIPSCPADSAISDSPAADVGISFAISRMSSRICASSASVAFTVFLTPAKALSNSEPFAMDTPSPAAAAVPVTAAADATALNEDTAALSIPENTGSASDRLFRNF